jgi:UDP-N-acetylglucosamine diphosphorylase/glucosamine-1-phosphate N-acetyltransferase
MGSAMKMCIFEDVAVGRLEPLTLTRPAFDLRCGATSLLDRQRRYFAAGETAALVRPELADLCRLQYPGLRVNDPSWLEGDPSGLVALVNARWLAPAAPFDWPGRPEVGLVGEQVAWVVVPASVAGGLSRDALPGRLDRWRENLPRRGAGGAMIAYPWDLVEHNGPALEQDFVPAAPAAPLPEGLSLVGPAERLRVDPEARVEPMVIIDTTKGPVTIERGAVVQAFSRIEGPCYVGPDTHVLGARVKGSSLGPQCRVGGEVEASIIHGHSNKAHDGFLGHSYLGEWVNFAAGTQTSDLRADYGTVRFQIDGQSVDSGRMKVGSFVGDHTRTSLNALFNTGSLVGPFGLLLTSGELLPRVLPAFCQVAHGRIQEQNDLRGMFATAATMMARRNREWTAEHAELFFWLYEATAGQRRQVLRESEQRRLRRVV